MSKRLQRVALSGRTQCGLASLICRIQPTAVVLFDKRGSGCVACSSFSSSATALFANVRIPAALFAGAAAGAAYALPVAAAEGLRVGLAKRLYALLMIQTLAAQLIVIVVATVSLSQIATGSTTTATMTTTSSNSPQQTKLAATLMDWMQQYHGGEWTTVQCQFLTGICTFSTAVALRAWITMICPVLATASVGILASSTLLALAFFEMAERQPLWRLWWQQYRVLAKAARTSPLFGLAALCYFVTLVYTACRIPHLYQYLALHR